MPTTPNPNSSNDPNAFTAADKPPTHEETLSSLHGATPDDDTAGEDETHFHGKALHELDGLTDDEVLALDGFGPATLKQVKAARRKRDNAK